LLINDTALIIVDMQKFYLSEESSYYKYFTHFWPDCMDYIIRRCRNTVTPNIRSLYSFFIENSCPVIFLRLCSKKNDRSDLHHFFRNTYLKGMEIGFEDIYPLENAPMSDVIDEIGPLPENDNITVINKTTYSAFTSTSIDSILRKKGINTLVFSGLATSQCVETTARDASDRDYNIIHIEDAQADYDEFSHNSSLYSSQGICGGMIFETEQFLNYYKNDLNDPIEKIC